MEHKATSRAAQAMLDLADREFVDGALKDILEFRKSWRDD
jgi:hypothetical protein